MLRLSLLYSKVTQSYILGIRFFFSGCNLWHGEAVLVPQPGMEPTPPALAAQSINPWTTREVLVFYALHYGLSEDFDYRSLCYIQWDLVALPILYVIVCVCSVVPNSLRPYLCTEIGTTLLTMKVLVVQSCPMLCNHVECSPPGSSVHGIL